MRYNKVERLGVIETDRIVTEELDWIFREQPIVDVGVDAIIEEAENGDPLGRFAALQIKTGDGNFHQSDKKITLYVSNIHYHYWLNFNIPIILIAHLPKSKNTFWQEISIQTLKKAKRQWKIDIPQNQLLNIKSKSKLAQILTVNIYKSYVFGIYKGKIEPDNLFDYAEKVSCIADSVGSVDSIISFIEDLNLRTNAFNAKLDSYLKKGLSDKDPQVIASIKGYGKDLNIISKRLENEVELFSEFYSEGFYAFEQVVLNYYLFTQNQVNLIDAKKSMAVVPDSIDDALGGIQPLRDTISKLPNKYAVLKEAKKLLLEIFDMLINEFIEAKEMANRIIYAIENEVK